MISYMAYVKYKGTRFNGFSLQQNGRSVQGELERALEELFCHPVRIRGSGRTDSGVHAIKQVIGFRATRKIRGSKIVSALNSKLPDDVSLYHCEIVDSSFHPRYSSVAKTYLYKIYIDDHRDPILDDLAWNVSYDLDIDLMKEAASKLVGTHDFYSFMASGSKIVDTVRTIYSIDIDVDGKNLDIYVKGNGFLYNMVRIMVGLMVEVSRGKIRIDYIEDIIKAKDRRKNALTSPSHGLYLYDVHF